MTADVLIVEDEPKIADLLRDYCGAEGWRCRVASRGDVVMGLVEERRPDLVLLDLQLPGRSGLDVCRDLRADSDVAIIMITARVDEIDRLLGLELGADDYICKPFSPREVIARARAVLRRTRHVQAADTVSLGPLTLDRAAREVRVGPTLLDLTPLEFDLLAAFLSRPREIQSRQRLLLQGRGTDYAGYERNIDTHIKNLRRKLRERLSGGDPFRTVYGVGYGLNMAAFELDVSGD